MPLLSMLSSRRTSEREESLFDVTESFNQALRAARKARGEPDEGLSRTLWEARRAAGRRPGTLLGIGVALVAGFAAMRMLRREGARSSLKQVTDKARERAAA